jgi:hypothetical protein
MNSNQYRINNFVKVENDFCRIVGITEDDFWVYPLEEKPFKVLSKNTQEKFISDIPMFESILLNFGFEESNAMENLAREWNIEYEIEKDRFAVIYNKTANYFYFSYSNGVDWIEVRIDYVHELQNLFYSLHKKELIYKPIG